MKRSKKLIILLAILLILLAAAGVLIISNQEDISKDPSVVLFAVNPEDVTQISWTYRGKTVDMVRKEQIWYSASNSSIQAEEKYLDAMLKAVSQVKSSRTLSNVTDLNPYGLKNPVCSVTVQAGRRIDFQIGNQSGVGDFRYISIGDGRIYLVDSGILKPFCYGLEEIIQKEKLPVMDHVTRLQIKTPDHSLNLLHQLDSGRTYSEEYVWFAQNGENLIAADPERTEALLDEIRNLEWKYSVSVFPNQEELEKYELVHPGTVITVTYEDHGEKTWTLELGQVSGDYCFARAADGKTVYKIDAKVWEALRYTTVYDLLPDDVLRLDWTTVTNLDLTVSGVPYSIHISAAQGAQGNGIQATCGEKKIDLSGIRNMLKEMQSTGYAYGAVPDGIPKLRFAFHRSTELFSDVEVCFYSHSRTWDLVTFNGNPYLFVPRIAAENLEALCLKTLNYC